MTDRASSAPSLKGVVFMSSPVLGSMGLPNRWNAACRLTPKAPPLIPGRTGLAVAALYGVGSITFVTAVFHTTTASSA